MSNNLTRSEKNAIIINESKGILHPNYYCCTTKSGKIQVRKRKTPLKSSESEAEPKASPEAVQHNESATEVQHNESAPEAEQHNEASYDTVTNKQLLEKMLMILEKNSESKDKNLNDPENEKVTEENKVFIENIKKDNDKEEHRNDNEQKQYKRTTRRRTLIVPVNSEPIIHTDLNRKGRKRVLN